MTTKTNLYIIIGAVFFLLSWLFVGVFRDDEFYEPNLFTKYQPTFKVNFYSPIGMSDLTVNDLPSDKKLEEIAFEEFVMKPHIQNNSTVRLWYLPFVLIQFTLTFLCFGVFKMNGHLVYEKWQLPTHLSLCIILTSVGIGFILSFDNFFLTIFLGLLILTINYCTLILLTRQRRKKSYT